MKRMSLEEGKGAREHRSQFPSSALPSPNTTFPQKMSCSTREWGDGGCRRKKLTRARKEDEEMGLGLSPYYTSFRIYLCTHLNPQNPTNWGPGWAYSV